MYNIDLYSYYKKPFCRSKKFTIHPIDEPGLEKYYSPDSHVTHYLKRTDPFVFRSILGMDYNSLIDFQKSEIKAIETPDSLKTLENIKSKNYEKSHHKTNFSTGGEEEKNGTNKRYNTAYGNETEEKKLNKKNILNKSHKNFRPYHKTRNFKELYGYENITRFNSKPEKYLQIINNLKYSSDKIEKNSYKRKYDGYTTYEIPLINVHTGKKEEDNLFSSTLKKTLKCLQKNNESGGTAMNEKELKQNLFNQTSLKFLKKYKLPDVLKIAGHTQLIRRQKVGLSKEMGEKYNPYQFIAISKNRTGRNYVGDLFKH